MILIFDLVCYFIDFFSVDVSVVVFCDVYDVYKNQFYEKCFRSIVKKVLQYLKDLGLGDVVYFGVESEFFIFDFIKIKDVFNF